MTVVYDSGFRGSRLKDLKVESGEQFDRHKRLAPVFAGMHINTINHWRSYGVSSIDVSDECVRVRFIGNGVLLYQNVETLCEAVDALELFCPEFKPCPVTKEFMIKHQGMKYTVEAIERASRARAVLDIQYNDLDVLPSQENLKAIAQIFTASSNNDDDDEINAFVRAPYKIVRNYLYACAFLEETPDLIDRLNALLGYRLGQAIADKKEPAETALTHLCQELNDFAQSHPDGGFGLCAVFKQDIFGNKKTDTVIVASDYGTVEVQHEPHLNPVDWENRFRDLSRRYGR